MKKNFKTLDETFYEGEDAELQAVYVGGFSMVMGFHTSPTEGPTQEAFMVIQLKEGEKMNLGPQLMLSEHLSRKLYNALGDGLAALEEQRGK